MFGAPPPEEPENSPNRRKRSATTAEPISSTDVPPKRKRPIATRIAGERLAGICGGLRIENSDRLAIALHPALQTVQLVAAIDEMVVVILVHSPTMRLENEGVAHPPEITPQNMADLDHFGRVVRDVASSRRILCPVR